MHFSARLGEVYYNEKRPCLLQLQTPKFLHTHQMHQYKSHKIKKVKTHLLANHMNFTNLLSAILLFASLNFYAFGQANAPEPYGPLPSENQMAWQQMEYYAFVHLSVNTYTDMAWGNGDEDPQNV